MIKFGVFVNGNPAQYPEFKVHPRWDNHEFTTEAEAQVYAKKWLGRYGEGVTLTIGVPRVYSEDGNTIEIRVISETGTAARVSGTRMLELGGPWLGVVRSWVQWNKPNGAGGNGESIIWGSSEAIRPAITMKELEKVCAEAVAAHINSILEKTTKE